MVVEAPLLGAVLASGYFATVQKNFLKEGLLLGAVWIVEKTSSCHVCRADTAGPTN
jgi:hypothetical protein